VRRIRSPTRVLGGQLDVQPQFLLEIAIVGSAAEGAPESRDPFTNGCQQTGDRRHGS
jgi:hypothetical protein